MRLWRVTFVYRNVAASEMSVPMPQIAMWRLLFFLSVLISDRILLFTKNVLRLNRNMKVLTSRRAPKEKRKPPSAYKVGEKSSEDMFIWNPHT